MVKRILLVLFGILLLVGVISSVGIISANHIDENCIHQGISGGDFERPVDSPNDDSDACITGTTATIWNEFTLDERTYLAVHASLGNTEHTLGLAVVNEHDQVVGGMNDTSQVVCMEERVGNDPDPETGEYITTVTCENVSYIRTTDGILDAGTYYVRVRASNINVLEVGSSKFSLEAHYRLDLTNNPDGAVYVWRTYDELDRYIGVDLVSVAWETSFVVKSSIIQRKVGNSWQTVCNDSASFNCFDSHEQSLLGQELEYRMVAFMTPDYYDPTELRYANRQIRVEYRPSPLRAITNPPTVRLVTPTAVPTPTLVPTPTPTFNNWCSEKGAGWHVHLNFLGIYDEECHNHHADVHPH